MALRGATSAAELAGLEATVGRGDAAFWDPLGLPFLLSPLPLELEDFLLEGLSSSLGRLDADRDSSSFCFRFAEALLAADGAGEWARGSSRA